MSDWARCRKGVGWVVTEKIGASSAAVALQV